MDDQTLTYRDTIRWLFDLQFVGIKLGLDNIRSLAAFWDNPHLRYPVIHIAGSNGKGSTASFIASTLQAAGYRTGLYTSPHLVDFSERIRVDGVCISEERVLAYARALRPEIDRLKATFFEATTLMAFQYFAEENVDVAVIETGLGGRLDATNLVSPVMTVITSLSIEHREFLGDTIEAIAAEKAGIMKPGIPCVTPNRDEGVLEVLRRHAVACEAPLHPVAVPEAAPVLLDLDRMECLLPGFDHSVDIGLVGTHQVENACTAVTALRQLAAGGFSRVTNASIAQGLLEVRTRSGIRGRLEQLQRHPELVADVGHNPDGIRAMLQCWQQVRDIKKTDLVFGVLKSKDLLGIFHTLTRYSPRSITLVQAVSHEARSLEEMLHEATRVGITAEGAGSAREAVLRKLEHAGDGAVLLFGSHYVVGAFLQEWEKKHKLR
ncbi:MAG: bifunctional folylpolyglutamate synthase/dihydrofolate synthase [Bacteroidetes bacterium]|nr:bifunctional folylpolyglutamate synthase/dihydrofolate synthase [Bacteroidota bacterium]